MTKQVRTVIAVTLPVVAVGVFLALAWSSAGFRSHLPSITARLPQTLYVLPVVGLVALGVHVAWSRRRDGSGAPDRLVVPPWLASRRWLVTPSSLAVAVIVYLVPLFAHWQAPLRPSPIAGVIPWKDAQVYFFGAHNLLLGESLDSPNSWHPMNTSFLATRFLVTGFDLRWSLVIQAVLVGVASFVAARVVAREFGALAGIMLFAGIYGFASFGLESTLTETLGITFGCLAFAALWEGVRARRPGLALSGLFILTLAFNTRAGAVLLLLGLCLWLARLFRDTARLNLRVLGAGVLAVVIGVAMNAFLVVALGGSVSDLNGNSSLTLYGLVKGNKGWQQLYADYPRLRKLPYSEQTSFAREKVIDELFSHPENLVVGMARSGRDYFRYSEAVIVVPVRNNPTLRYAIYVIAAVVGAVVLAQRWKRSGSARALRDLGLFASVIVAPPMLFGLWDTPVPSWLPLAFGLTVAGFVAYVLLGARGDSPLWSLAVVSTLAIAASVTFVPILDAGPRVYAVTVPFIALSAAGAVAILQRVLVRAPAVTTTAPVQSSRWSLTAPVLAGLIATAIFVVTPIAYLTGDRPQAQSRMCPGGRRATAFTGGVAVHLVRPENQASVDDVAVDSFDLSGIEIQRSLTNLKAGTTLLDTIAVDPRRGLVSVAVIDGDVDAPGGGVLHLCGRYTLDGIFTVFVGKPLVRP